MCTLFTEAWIPDFPCPAVVRFVLARVVLCVTVSSASPAWASTAREYAYTKAASWGPERGDGEACFEPDGGIFGLRGSRKDGRGVVVEWSVSSGDSGGGQALWSNSTSVSKTVAPSTWTPAAPTRTSPPGQIARGRLGGLVSCRFAHMTDAPVKPAPALLAHLPCFMPTNLAANFPSRPDVMREKNTNSP